MLSFNTSDATLIFQARQAARSAYSPYSKFRVGAAAVFTDCSQIYTGCNVENGSYGLTICAERVAICTGAAAGTRQLKKIAVAVLDADGTPGTSFMPCGACLQFIAEFGRPDTEIIVDGVAKYTLQELLPAPFIVQGFK